jgi:hypothetical protein
VGIDSALPPEVVIAGSELIKERGLPKRLGMSKKTDLRKYLKGFIIALF